MAKDFSNVNTQGVYETIAEGRAQDAQEVQETRKPRKTYTEQEAREAMQQGKTSGRKGVSLHRLNLGLWLDNFEYVRIMSRATGKNMNEFINTILELHREEHKDVYDEARKFIEKIEG